MKKNKLGNLSELSEIKELHTGEVIHPASSTKLGVNKGEVVLRAIESFPAIVEHISGTIQSVQVTKQQKELTKQMQANAEENIARIQSSTAHLLSENEKEIQKLKNEDSKNEREAKLLREQQNGQKEFESKKLELEHLQIMKKLDLDGQKLNIHNSHIEFLQKTIESKAKKGEDYALEQSLLIEALQRITTVQ